MNLDRLFAELKKYKGEGAFNQYAEADAALDLPGAAGVRLDNLNTYLETFKSARFILVGEAPSFHGCRFSGIPFTSEEQLLGENALWWARGGKYKRTSTRARLMSEHSGSIVWECIAGRRDIVLWNAFPWHSHKLDDPAKNRKPSLKELEAASGVLAMFTGLFPKARVYAVGRTAEHSLSGIGVSAGYIRHPARGGKPLFRSGIDSIR